MKTDTSDKILDYIQQNGQVTVQDLIKYLGHSPQAVHRQLKKLTDSNQLQKIGTPPRVYYQLATKYEIDQGSQVADNLSDFLEDKFIQILPNGTELRGKQAFHYWCKQRDYDDLEYVKKYQEIYAKYNFYKNPQGLIEATSKLENTYKNQNYLNKLFYLEFSALEIFGKTKAYTYLLYSKLNEDRKLMLKIFKDLQVSKKVNSIIDLFQIQAVGFIPPTVPRKIQIQRELEGFLNLNLPKIEIQKIQTPIMVPQKTLSTTRDRIINSQTTFVVPKSNFHEKILLIDDFAGSGATLNFVAKKILDKTQTNEAKIYGLTLCGTPNGLVNNSQKFEIVKEI